jgi:hypothetical protein
MANTLKAALWLGALFFFLVFSSTLYSAVALVIE